jgi:hypothetical protein
LEAPGGSQYRGMCKFSSIYLGRIATDHRQRSQKVYEHDNSAQLSLWHKCRIFLQLYASFSTKSAKETMSNIDYSPISETGQS